MGSVVCKFGGSSVANATMVRKVEDIVKADPRRRFVVVSAPGKRHGGDRKITDLLFLCHQLSANDVDFAAPFEVIDERFRTMAEQLGVEGVADDALEELRTGIINGHSVDWIASRGEHINARIVAAALGATFVETADLLGIDHLGLPTPDSYERLAAALAGDGLFVIPGYYGRGPDGEVKVFSRGGSDITGAVVAKAVGADVYENWTDVSGLMMADPRIVHDARPMREVTYAELRELAYMGASVLHDEAVFPVREAGIPIHIKNTNSPEDPGTRIVSSRDSSRNPVVGIAGKDTFTVIHIAKSLMNKEVGFGRRVLAILEAHGISFEHVPTGIDSMSVVVSDEALGDKGEQVLDEIRRQLEPDQAALHSDLALLSIVGEGMDHQVGISGRCFQSLGRARVNVRMISQGIGEISIIVGVARSDFETAMRALYDAFVAGQEPHS